MLKRSSQIMLGLLLVFVGAQEAVRFYIAIQEHCMSSCFSRAQLDIELAIAGVLFGVGVVLIWARRID